MSIASSIYADYANEIKHEWEQKLRDAVEHNDMVEVKEVLREIEEFQFSE